MTAEPEIFPLLLAELTLPEWHPEARAGDGACMLQGFAVRDGDDTVLVDTGIGVGAPLIDQLYQPKRRPVGEALGEVGIALADITAVVNSHLHFDHCGNNVLFPGVPITVQRVEYEAAHATPHYTVLDWVDAPGLGSSLNYHLIDGEAAVTSRTRVIPTPGHTPGHQSLVVSSAEGEAIVVCQAAYTAREFEDTRDGGVVDSPGQWEDTVYRTSLERLHALAPQRAFFSHDPEIWLRSGSR